MTALEHCFLLEERSRLNFSTMLAIYKVCERIHGHVTCCCAQCHILVSSQGFKVAHVMQSGFTRIPVYSGVRQNITGVLYVKDLILIDPDDNTELGSVLAFRCVKGCCK